MRERESASEKNKRSEGERYTETRQSPGQDNKASYRASRCREKVTRGRP